MSALERVARRIGMTYQPATDGTRAYWYDEGDCDSEAWVDPAELRTYLLTGDRPLRWLRDWIAEGGTDPAKVGRFVEISVCASGVRLIVYYIGPHNGKRFEAATLDAAIIALAERIEGEGRE